MDASNLHVGGGIQVAASLIEGLLNPPPGDPAFDWVPRSEFVCSTEVAENLRDSSSSQIKVVGRSDRMKANQARLHLLVFGPLWHRRRGHQLMMGYADVTSIYPGFTAGLKARLRAVLSRRSVCQADVVVVETAEIARQLTHLGVPPSRIEVVSNSYHQLFDREPWAVPESSCRSRATKLTLGYVTRPYPHKNMGLLPEIARHLFVTHGVEARFAVTLTDREYSSMGPEFTSVTVNHGRLRVDELPMFYRSVDGVVFPSLLEAFSATPLEAMRMGKPLFASDRPFVRSICRDAPYYADPFDPAAWATKIAAAYSDTGSLADAVRRGHQVVAGLPAAAERTKAYAELVSRTLNRP